MIIQEIVDNIVELLEEEGRLDEVTDPEDQFNLYVKVCNNFLAQGILTEEEFTEATRLW